MTALHRIPEPAGALVHPQAPLRAGERARELLLEAAGKVFAEKGYGRATSKEICERAGLNSASVNYHFGGIEPLYAQTLSYAHSRLVTIEALKDVASSDAGVLEKLETIIELIVRRLAVPVASWEMRLLSREIISPSPARAAFFEAEILPKLAVMRAIIAPLIGAEPQDPVVGRTILTVVAPALVLAISQHTMLENLIPGLADTSQAGAPSEIELLIAHFQRFIHAGLQAVAAERQAGRP